MVGELGMFLEIIQTGRAHQRAFALLEHVMLLGPRQGVRPARLEGALDGQGTTISPGALGRADANDPEVSEA